MLSLIIEVFLVCVYVLTLVIEILLELIACSCLEHSWHFFPISVLKLVWYALINWNLAELGVRVVLLPIASKVYK